MLNQIKTLLNIEVKLEEMKLENGTIVSAESFEKGKEIFIVTDDEKVAMPVGEYLLENGNLVVVEEEGKIADVREVSDEVPAKEEESDDKEITEDLAEEEEKEEEMADVADWEGMEKRIQNLEDAIADLKADKVDAPKEVEATAELSEEVKEEIKEDVEVELSAVETVAPVKHNPEAKNESKFTLKKNNYPETLQSRIYAKLNS